MAAAAINYTIQDSNSDAISGGLVHAYIKGTTTRQTVYTDNELTVPASNPVVANSDGQVLFYLDAALNYFLDFRDDADASIRLQLNYTSGDAEPVTFVGGPVNALNGLTVSLIDLASEIKLVAANGVDISIAADNIDAIRDAANGDPLDYDSLLDKPGIIVQFATRAAAVAAGADTKSASEISVGGYRFKYDAAGTALTTGDGRTWSPQGRVFIQHFSENTSEGTTDLRVAAQAAIAYANSIQSGDSIVQVSGNNETIGISQDGSLWGLNMNQATGVELVDAKFIAIGAWATGTYMINISDGGGTRPIACNTDHIRIDCQFKCGGIRRRNADRCQDLGSRVTHMEADSAGFYTEATCTEYIADACQAFQYVFGEVGYDDSSNRTADGFYLQTADRVVRECTAAFCRYPLRLAGGGGPSQQSGHFYNGALTGPDGDYYSVYIEDSPNAVITNLYADNGSILIDADFLTDATNGLLINGFLTHRNGNGSNTIHIIITTSVANNDLSGLIMMAGLASGNLATNIELRTTGAGSYSSALKHTMIGFVRADGGQPTGGSAFRVLDLLELRDDNSFHVKEGLRLNAGTVSGPAISKQGDTNTGIYYPQDNALGISANGVAAAQFSADGSDFLIPMRTAPISAPGGVAAGQAGIYVDESTNTVEVVYRKTDGTLLRSVL